jgi:hypothetical protein
MRFGHKFLSVGEFPTEQLIFCGFCYTVVNSTAVLPTSLKTFCQISQKIGPFLNMKRQRQIFDFFGP